MNTKCSNHRWNKHLNARSENIPLNDKHFDKVAQADDNVCLHYTKMGKSWF